MTTEMTHVSVDDAEICDSARRVIESEADALKAMAKRIDHHFVKACQLLLHCQGRIVVTGVGKSGHIGKKIAATFASTGSPSFFVHPNEAKHGDIGMITSKDVLLAISNSGEAEEIIFILPVIKRLHVPLITLTGKPHSTLAKAANINLDVSVEKEACPLGLAPTSSTTAALTMGDALAVSLLQQRGFTQEDFALSHPGGLLGRRLLLTVDEIMHANEAMPKVFPHTLLKAAIVEMSHKSLGMTTVIDETQHLHGIFTDGDLRRQFDQNIDVHQTQIHEVMIKNPKVITKGTLAVQALEMMQQHKITSLVVVDQDLHAVGVVHLHDLLRSGIR